MTKAELIDRIARSRELPPDLTKKCIAQILDIAFDELAGYFARAKVTKANSPRFSFPRFGTFTKKKRSARRGVNPRTLEPMQIDAANTIDFKASRELRETMNSPRSKTRRTAAKKTARAKSKAKPRAKASAPGKSTRSRRKALTPRDEDAELDALIDDDVLFEDPSPDELPDPPMQRVRPKGKRARTG